MSIKLSFPDKELQDKLRPQRDINSIVLLGLILFFGAAARIYNLGTESYWVDEIYTIYEGQQNVHQLLMSGRLDQPLAYFVPFHFWIQVFGTTEVSTRLFSAVAGVGSIILIYLIGRELFGREVGLISAFLMAISGFQVFFSQETRFYAFFEFTTLLSFLFFILALNNRSIIYYIFYCLASILMLYSHTYGVFVLAAQNLFFVLQIKKYRKIIAGWLICQISILVAFLPYFIPVIFGSGGLIGAASLNSTGSTTPSLLDPLRFTYRFIMPARGERNLIVMLVNYAVAGVFLVVGIWMYALRQGKSKLGIAVRGLLANLQEEVPDIKSKVLLLGCWFLIPMMLPFIFSFVITPMYRDRYTICAAPALYLFMALGIFSVRKVMPLIVSIGVLAVVTLPSLHYYYVTDVHQQWKEAAAYVKDFSVSGDMIVFAGGMGTGVEQKSFNWYYQDTLPSCTLSNDLASPSMKSDALMKCVSDSRRFWVIIRDSTEPSISADTYKSFFASSSERSMRLIKSRQFVDISAFLFELTK